jgi:hypothetical protein
VNKLLILAVLALSGCGTFTTMENVAIDNSTVNNYVGNPCGFYLNDKCIYFKARNPDTPYPK